MGRLGEGFVSIFASDGPLQGVRRAALGTLEAYDPIVQRLRVVEAELDPAFRFLSGDAPAGASHHGGTSLRWNGAEVTYPRSEPVGPPDLHAPHLERASNARAKCKVCKATLAAGELRLRVRHKFFPVETFYAHLPCAAAGKRGPLLGTSQLEREDGPLLLVALRRSRLRFPERDAMLAQLDPSLVAS